MSPSPALTQADQHTQDLSAVKNEWWRWCATEVITDADQIAKFDLVRSRQVRCQWSSFLKFASDLVEISQSKKRKYPILYKVALDIIPVQASAVLSEPVFSSNTQTDTDQRSNTNGSLTEVLQILKYPGRSRS